MKKNRINTMRSLIRMCIRTQRGRRNRSMPQQSILYAFIYSPGPQWIPGKPVTEQPLQEHMGYMVELKKQGK
jgi:hypothetical protein